MEFVTLRPPGGGITLKPMRDEKWLYGQEKSGTFRLELSDDAKAEFLEYSLASLVIPPL